MSGRFHTSLLYLLGKSPCYAVGMKLEAEGINVEGRSVYIGGVLENEMSVLTRKLENELQ